MARTRTSRLLNISVDFPLADDAVTHATKTPDFVAAKVGDEQFGIVQVSLMIRSVGSVSRLSFGYLCWPSHSGLSFLSERVTNLVWVGAGLTTLCVRS